MKTTLVSVSEHAWLTTEAVSPSFGCAQISETAFNYLCALNESFRRSGARLAQIDGNRRLKLDSHVGIVQTPCGTLLEIVPKHHDLERPLAHARGLLRKLLSTMLDLPAREAGPARLALFDAPLSEWVMRRYLEALNTLIKQGLRFGYCREDAELPFLRGQLNLAAQLRQPLGREHRFQVRHEVYLPDRAENRLLRLALERVRLATQSPDNWRLAQELSHRLAEIPPSRQIDEDFRRWGQDRLMAHYQSIQPWCELILKSGMPIALQGSHEGISLLFPMERLFEGFVSAWLRQRLQPETDMRTPARSKSLCLHKNRPIFRLEPDILVSSSSGSSWILDTKWKLLNATAPDDKYGLSQADFYQLYAYGQKYLEGRGQMALIYPKTSRFNRPLAPFDFGGGLSLLVLPFDLEQEALIGAEQLALPWRHNALTVEPELAA